MWHSIYGKNPVFFPSSIYCKSDVTGEKLNANVRLWVLKEEVLLTNISKVYIFSLNVIKSAIQKLKITFCSYFPQHHQHSAG